ncbi:hypothetical protein [Cellulomonas sp. URHB0016]
MDIASPPSLEWHTCRTEPGYVGAVTRTQYRHLAGRRVWLLTALLAVVVAALVVDPGGPSLFLAGAVVVVAGLVVLGYVRAVRQVPTGTVISAAIGTHHLHVRGPVVKEAEVHYSAFKDVTVRGRLVVLELRSGGQVMVLPLVLFPGPVLDELRRRVRTSQAPGVPSAARAARSGSRAREGRRIATYTTDEGFAQRLTRATFRELVLTPVKLGVLGAVALVGTAVAGTKGVVAVMTVVLLLPLAMAAMWWRAYVGLRRRVAADVPAGSTYLAAADDDGLWLAGPVVTTEKRYSEITRVRVRGGFLFLQQRATRTWVVYPAQLFPGSALDDLRERVAAAPGPTAATAS